MKLPCKRCQRQLVDVDAAALCTTCVNAPVAIPAQLAGACGDCGRPMLLCIGRWTTCAVCETQTTALP